MSRRWSCRFFFCKLNHSIQKLKADAAVAQKDLAGHEKQQVSLQERKKHASSKSKKLKKSIHDVCLHLVCSSERKSLTLIHQNDRAKHEAIRFISTSAEKMEKEQAKIAEYEESLSKEEKVLERIQDGLKGNVILTWATF